MSRAVEPQAWCYFCKRLRPFRDPLPTARTIVRRLIPVKDTRVDEAWLRAHPAEPSRHVVSLREGWCADCGKPVYRVGGGRSGEASPLEATDGRDEPQGDLFPDQGTEAT